jgi:peptidyl-prolyl cis-trans isomerase C
MLDISVNGVAISAAAVAQEAQHHRAPDAEAAQTEAARALAVRELLLQRAGALGLVASPHSEGGVRESEEEALIRAVLEADVKAPVATKAECRRYYETHRQRFRSPDLFEPAHILFSAPRADADAYAAALARAEAAIAAVQADPGCFETLARTQSDCSSREQGGRLGQVTRGETTPEFETFLLALEPGQLCSVPVQTRYGVHVLRLDRRADGQELPFEVANSRIASFLQEASWRRAVAQYIALLAGQARIEGVALRASASPLVQ